MRTRTTAANSGLAKVAVQCSADTFVVNQTLVLRINICGENRHLCQAANRYRQCKEKHIMHRFEHFLYRFILKCINYVDFYIKDIIFV
jgi:hypothetical protein